MLPKTHAEVDLSGDWLNTPSESRFLLQNDGIDDRILIFATNDMLQRLCELKTIYVDGTFQVCPAIFTQLFTINGFINSRQFPLMYGLLSPKSRDDYNRFFS